MHYESNFSWSHLLGKHALAHHDGAVSVMMAVPGVDGELRSQEQLDAHWEVLYRLLDKLPEGYVLEVHNWRAPDDELARRYLDIGKRAPRRTSFSDYVRNCQALHLSRHAKGNRTAMVLTAVHREGWWPGARGALRRQSKNALRLEQRARELIKLLGEGKLLDGTEYVRAIARSLCGSAEAPPRLQPQLLLNEQLVRYRPQPSGQALKGRGWFRRTILLYLYPDASPGWYQPLAALPADAHACQVIMAADTRRLMRKSEREQDVGEGMASGRGRDQARVGLHDLAAFRQWVAEHGLNIFRNAYLVALTSPDLAELEESRAMLADYVERNGGALRDAPDMQLPFYRVMQPGQGYRCPFFRPDHTWQVANMMPMQVFSQGERSRPESLRQGVGSQLIGFNLSGESIAHSFTIAMTGAGKGVDKGATILETYPFGIDWYIAEIGQSYRWVVESLGGVYTCVDPDHNAVNPLPPWQAANEGDELPLNATIAGNTTQALGFLLTGGHIAMNAHQQAAAQLALQCLYREPDRSRTAPNLRDFCQQLVKGDHLTNRHQREAARDMAANLESFLSTTEGRLFEREDNVSLSEGITGVDLKDVANASGELLKFYLVFLSLRMAQLAFYRKTSSRILLDEMHVFASAFPEVIGKMISSIARMGRKESAYIDLVTQGLSEIDCIDSEVLNSIPLRTLLYRPDGHDAIASRIAMPAGPLAAWRNFPYPEKLSWRPGVRSVGERWFNLKLSFPAELLAVVDTSRLALKESIASQTADPLERIRLFCEACAPKT